MKTKKYKINYPALIFIVLMLAAWAMAIYYGMSSFQNERLNNLIEQK